MIHKKVERDLKMESLLGKKNKELLDINRDVAEKIALGEDVNVLNIKVLKFDDRLFQEKGLDSGHGGSIMKIYDEPLFKEKIKMNIYTGAQQFNDLGEDDDEEVFLRKKEIFRK